MSGYRVVLDESVPLGKIQVERTVVLINPDSDLRAVLAANPGVEFSLSPREGAGEGRYPSHWTPEDIAFAQQGGDPDD